MKQLSIVIPVKNEEKNISKLVILIDKYLKKDHISYEIICIDDHSTDHTLDTINQLQKDYSINAHIKKGKAGKAFSILEGAEYAESEFVCMIDADLQYSPKHIPVMYQAVSSDQRAGVVIAERKVYKGKFSRRLSSRINAFVFGTLLFGLKHDIQSGLKIFRKDIIKHIEVDKVGPWSFDIPLLHTARELGYAIKNVPITYEHRENGESKISFISTAKEIALNALKLKLKGTKTYVIDPHNEKSMLGAGVIHKKKRYITHSTLPHRHSAIFTLKTWQKSILFGLFLLLIVSSAVSIIRTLTVVMAVLSTIYFLDVLFNLYMVLKSLHFPHEIKFEKNDLDEIDESKLPIYSILCPLYREAHMIPQFIKAIDQLDWPKKKLDVMLLLEEDDVHSIRQIKKMELPRYVRVIVVPDSEPKTKPKATNYGLAHSKGEYIVIYDAEDIPDPLQLKKAYLGFQNSPKNIACLQAKLNYYNPHQNLLTRLFTAEYSLWFDVILPGLQSIETTIPLGGTSNHFRKNDLEKLHGWDPFNVTEDCDLGTRLFKLGYKTAIFDSTTLEEANSNLKNWIRQRSRWIKGYIQTYFIHMREPVAFTRKHRHHALIFNVVIGGKIAFLFINPLLWITTIAYFIAYAYVGPQIEAIFPSVVFYMAAASLIFGNFLYIYYYMIGTAKRDHWDVIKFIFLVPFYWLFVSFAALIAVIQLITRPHYWEKTIHGFHLNSNINSEKITTSVGLKTIKPQSFSATRDSFISPETISLPIIGRLIKNSLNSSYLIIGSVIGYFLNFLTNLYLGQKLSIEEFGLVSLMGSFFFLSIIILGPLSSTITHQVAYTLGKYSKPAIDFWMKVRKYSFYGSLVICGVWLLFLNQLNVFFKSDSLVPFAMFAPVWIIATLISIDRGFILGNLWFKFVAAAVVVESIAKLILSIGFVYFGYPEYVYAAMPLSLFTGFVMILVGNFHFLQKQDRVEKVQISFPKRFFTSSIITNTAGIAFLSMDLILAKHFLTSSEAGQYALLSFVGKIIFFMGTLFSQFINPMISNIKGKNKDTRKVFYILLLGIFALSGFGYVVLGIFGNVVLPYLFGNKAQTIIPYLHEYGLTMIFFTIASAIVAYHQARKEYMLSVASLIIILMQIIGINAFHQNIGIFIRVMFAVSAIYLSISLFLHILYDMLTAFGSNIHDLLDLLNSKTKKEPKNGTLRILILNWRDTKHLWAGGAEVYLQELAESWVNEGHKVTIFCGNDGKNPRNEIVNNVQVVRRGGFYTVYIWAFLYYILRFKRYFDIVVDSQNGVPFFTPLYTRVPKALLIHHVHQEVFRRHLRFPLSYIAQFIEGQLMPLAYRKTKLITVSESSKREMIKLGMGKRELIEVVHPGVNIKSFKKISKTGYPSFVYLGRLKEYKNIDTIIKAFAQIVTAFPNAKLTIAGFGEEEGKLKKLTSNLKLNRSIKFLGKINETKKNQVLGESWAALQPSGIEGFGITVIEANACGTPVIASKAHGLNESVVDEKTGFLVSVKSVDEFGQRMISIIEDQKLRERLSKNAYDWAQEFNWKKSSDKFLNALVVGLAGEFNLQMLRKSLSLKINS